VTEWIDIARVAVAVGGLAVASYTDIRTREVPDGLWYALAVVAIALFGLDLDARFGGMAWVLTVPVALVFVVAVTGGEIFTVIPGDDIPEGPIELSPGQERIWRIDQAITVALLAAAATTFLVAPGLDLGEPAPRPTGGPEAMAFSTCLMLAAALLFYFMGALHGGADAKGFMVVALLFPTAPVLAGLPLWPGNAGVAEVLPFALVVLFNGALLLVVAGPLMFAAIGARRGRFKWPHSFAGYAKPLDQVNLEREFLMGSVEDGMWRPRFMVSRGSHSAGKQVEALEFLKSAGETEVFVSPKFPFMVYMLLGLLLAVVATSPLYLL
jgi:hypothetical protein